MRLQNFVRLLAVMLFVVTGIATNAQGVIVYKKDGTRINVPYSQFDSIVSYEASVSQSGEPVAIDLGLPSGTLWASFNVGATKPEEAGGFYAWGETSVKGEYTKENYKYYDTTAKKNIYIGDNISGTQYDVAHLVWGQGWRMPTKADFEELHDSCFWTWTTVNGVSGYEVSSYNGNSIFLPAAGKQYETSISDEGVCGYYWTGTVRENSLLYSWAMYFRNGRPIMDYCNRFTGYCVRPVLK